MTVKLGPAWITPGGRYDKGIWHGLPFGPDDIVERYITSEFGAWEDFRKALGWSPHSGVDIHAPTGTPLHAMADGKVEMNRASGMYPVAGKYVQILHEDNLITQYLHMDHIDSAIVLGGRVERGQYIGMSGNTSSMAIAPHLHLTVREGHLTSVNPEKHIARQIGGPELDRETAQEWFVSEYFTGRTSYAGTRSMGAPEFVGFDGNVERWEISLLRPKAERPGELN